MANPKEDPQGCLNTQQLQAARRIVYASRIPPRPLEAWRLGRLEAWKLGEAWKGLERLGEAYAKGFKTEAKRLRG